MGITKLELVKADARGSVFAAESFKIVYRHQGTTSGDNAQNAKELIILISGIAEVTVGDSIQRVQAPARIVVPAETYHKIDAATDITFLLL